MIHFTNPFNLELRLQVLERLGATRQAQAGFNRSVLLYDLVMTDTVDEEVLDVLTEKRSIQDALMLARSRRGDGPYKGFDVLDIPAPAAGTLQPADFTWTEVPGEFDVNDLLGI